jgi:predicted ATPase
LEHLVTVGPELVSLVNAAPRLTLVLTSRRVLHLSGEQVYPVLPLEEDDAVELFLQRARALRPSLALTPEVETDVREICRRLDGLPLAIELAAARSGTLTPRALLARLGSRLSVLTAGPRDLPARQQTLRETLDWSADLLAEEERRSLARLAVFPGGCSLESAEAFCGADLDTLSSLVDHSLVRRVDLNGEPRFLLLETIREYAYELLGPQRSEVETAYTTFFLGLVEETDLRGPAAARWMTLLDGEIDNIRAALDFAVAYGDAESELRLVAVLWRYWWVRGHLAEGRGRTEAALTRAADVPRSLQTRVLFGAGILAWCVGDYQHGHEVATQLLAAADATGSLSDEHAAYKLLGMIALRERDFAASERYARRTVQLAHALGDEIDVLIAELNLAVLVLDSGQIEALRPDVRGRPRPLSPQRQRRGYRPGAPQSRGGRVPPS